MCLSPKESPKTKKKPLNNFFVIFYFIFCEFFYVCGELEQITCSENVGEVALFFFDFLPCTHDALKHIVSLDKIGEEVIVVQGGNLDSTLTLKQKIKQKLKIN